jgi:hypothetical protein
VAFHLHRLKLVRQALLDAGYDKTDAADIAAAKTPLSPSKVDRLARSLSVDISELARPLTPDELRAWHFYRASASNPEHVWSSARRAWRAAGYSDARAARVMGFATPIISRALSVPTRHTLSFERAARLTTALNISEGPEALLPLHPRDDHQQSHEC